MHPQRRRLCRGSFLNARPTDERYARGVDVSVESDSEAGLTVKLQTDDWEVNFRASADDLLRLSDIRSADWSDRRSIQVGESAGAPVFWAITNDHASVMIGHDDETWDIAVALPFGVVDEIVREAQRTRW
jgi:hypothetical protein